MAFAKTSSDKLKLPAGLNLLRQTYDKDPLPSGAVVIKLSVYPDDEGGWFKENLRLDENGCVKALQDLGITFKFVQTNTNFLAPGTKRFWHIHPPKGNDPGQNEIWIPSGTLLAGLVDFRRNSPTFGKKCKLILSPDRALFIPAGLAHGFINPTDQYISLTYFVDRYFVATEATQEHRLDPKDLSFDFVEPEIM